MLWKRTHGSVKLQRESLVHRGGRLRASALEAVCPTRVGCAELWVVVPSHFDVFARPWRARQLGPRAGKPRVGRDGDFLKFTANERHLLP